METIQTTEVQETETQTTDEEKVTMTKAELEALLQSNGDKRVTQALKKQEEKNQFKLKEAEKLARMNESEKFQYELEQREQAIIAKEKALAMSENKNVALGILAEKGISTKLVDFVIDEDADVMNTRIKLLDDEFKKCVRVEVEKRLSSKAPKASIGVDKTVTKKDIKSMTTQDLIALKEQDPELFESLKAQLYNK